MITVSHNEKMERIRRSAGHLLNRTFYPFDSVEKIADELIYELERQKGKNKAVSTPISDRGMLNPDPTDLEIELNNRVEELESENIRLMNLAAANGYVKVDDYEVLKAKVAGLTDLLEDATSTLDQIEAESACFDGLARSAGYVKLEPGQVVVDAAEVSEALRVLCAPCKADCFKCHFARLNAAIKEARNE